VGRSLWRENGSAVYNCCWSSPAQSFLGPSPGGLVTIFYYVRLGITPTWGSGPRIHIPQEHGGPIITPDTGFPFRGLLRLAGLRWRYSNPPPRGEVTDSLNCTANCPQISSPALTTQKTQPLYCCRGVFTEPLRTKCGGTGHIKNIVLLLLCAWMLRALLSKGRCLKSHCLTTGLYATMCLMK
jgi:hypothetical protein